MSAIITTAGRPDEYTHMLTKEAHAALGFPIVERKKRSVRKMQEIYHADVLVAGKQRFELYKVGTDEPFFFHPNSAAFRLKRLQKGEKDPLIDICELKSGDSFLDCTLGLASDSIIASYIIGDGGRITGVEADEMVAFITDKGLKSFEVDSISLRRSMERITVIHDEAIRFLKVQPDQSWDVVYIDPMFHRPIDESSNFTALRDAGVHSVLSARWVEEALRVCKRRVVVKERFDSPVFERFSLNRKIRPNTKFHFGYLDR